MRFSSEMLSEFVRPVIRLDSVYRGCKVLIDSGAEFAVWTAGDNELERLGARKLNATTTIGGFGGNGEECNLYRYTVKIGEIIFPELLIASGCRHINRFQLILPACMFQKFEMSIDFPARRFTVSNMSNQISYNYYVYDKDGNKIILTQEIYEISESNNDDFRLDPIPETDASSIHFDDKPIGTLGSLK